MKRPYTVQLWTADRHNGGHVLSHERAFRTAASAETYAHKVLRKHRFTHTRYTYHRDAARAAGCMVLHGKREIQVVEAEAIEVPSVCELGWTP